MPVRLDDNNGRAEAWLRGQVDTGRVPGLQYVSVSADRVRLDVALGHADLERGSAITPDTTMMAYSMSKTVTAIAVLQLVEAGLVALDAPVTQYVSEVPYGDQLTVRHCLAHTGGLPNPIPLRWVHGVAAHASFDERAARAAVWRACPRLSSPPGTRFAYSNIGYWILGALVEQVTGAPLSAHVAARIREPLGLTPADLGYTVLDPARQAGGYLERWSWMHLLAPLLVEPALLGPRHGAWRRIEAHYPNGAGFGGLVGTARAFARLLQDQLRPASVLLREETRALLYRREQTAAGQSVPMTLGWHVGTVDGAPCYFKEGGGGGFHALMRLCPARGTGAVLMCNATRFDVTACLDTVEALLHAS